MANGATIQDLTTTPGLRELTRRLAGVSGFYNEPGSAANVSTTIQNYLKADPRLKGVDYKSDLEHKVAIIRIKTSLPWVL